MIYSKTPPTKINKNLISKLINEEILNLEIPNRYKDGGNPFYCYQSKTITSKRYTITL